jgi:hypothetical protein
MTVRRLLAGVLLAGLAVPTLAAAPHARAPHAAPAPLERLPLGSGSRVFARADAEPPAAASAEPSPAASIPAASMPSPETAARARAVFEANRSGKIDRSAYTAELNGKMTDAAVARMAMELRALGEVKSFTQIRKVTQGPLSVYVFRIEFDKPQAIEEAIGWDAAGRIDILQFGLAR